MGNVEQVNHSANSNNFTRNFNYNSGVNTLSNIETGSGTNIQSFTYDAAGNQLTAGTSRHYIWNSANQLKAYCKQAGTAEPTVYAQYLYDAGGNRVKKLVRNQGGNYATIVYIDGAFEYHKLETTSTLEKNETHIMDNRSRIAVIRDGDSFLNDIDAEYYVLEDHLGSGMLRLKATAGGTVLDREEYYPFGDSSLRTWTKKRYQYVGKEKDSESGLYYYGARYYAAWMCRFISVDPLASKFADLTPYNYAGNKPINKVDIDGLQEENREGTPGSGSNGGSGGKPEQSQQESVDNILYHGGTFPVFEVVDQKPNNWLSKSIESFAQKVTQLEQGLKGSGEKFEFEKQLKGNSTMSFGVVFTGGENNNPDAAKSDGSDTFELPNDMYELFDTRSSRRMDTYSIQKMKYKVNQKTEVEVTKIDMEMSTQLLMDNKIITRTTKTTMQVTVIKQTTTIKGERVTHFELQIKEPPSIHDKTSLKDHASAPHTKVIEQPKEKNDTTFYIGTIETYTDSADGKKYLRFPGYWKTIPRDSMNWYQENNYNKK